MKLRRFGNTDLYLSEYGFGAWGIGGKSYGPVAKQDAMNALATAEEYGCNLIDTANVYGSSEEIVGEFLKNRRSKWILSTKYSGQQAGMTRTVEDQLEILKTDVIDFYQIHWMPDISSELFIELEKLKASGKIRYVGVSLHTEKDIRVALKIPLIDGFQVACSLLDPSPYTTALDKISQSGKGVLIRSSLKSGLLSGKYDENSNFNKDLDHRFNLSKAELHRIFGSAKEFEFLSSNHGSLFSAAARYPLAFSSTSSVLLGTKNSRQAEINFHDFPKRKLTPAELSKIELTQKRLKLFSQKSLLAALLSSIKERIFM